MNPNDTQTTNFDPDAEARARLNRAAAADSPDRFSPEAKHQIEALIGENQGLLKAARVKEKTIHGYKECLDEAAREIGRTANVLDIIQDVLCWAPTSQFTPDELRAILKFIGLMLTAKRDDLNILFTENYRYNPAAKNGGVRD